MKRRMIWIFLAGALVGIVLSGLYKHFVTDQIMDGGNGMENPYVWYKISIAPEAYRKPRRLCLFLL